MGLIFGMLHKLLVWGKGVRREEDGQGRKEEKRGFRTGQLDLELNKGNVLWSGRRKDLYQRIYSSPFFVLFCFFIAIDS